MKLKLLFIAFLIAIQVKSQTVVDIIVNSPVHNTLEAAVVAAGLATPLSGDGPFTVFAPTDQAFAALPAGTVQSLLADPQGALTKILTYHVLPFKSNAGGLYYSETTLNGKTVRITRERNTIFVNNAKITVKNIKAKNGIVHVIDAVLIPPTSVADIIENSSVHNTLEAALKAANLTKTLAGSGHFTVFAPTDAAFSALPAGTVESLLANPQGALKSILLYHVLGRTVPSTSLINNQWLETVNGKSVVVKIENGNVFIDNAKVTVKDIKADNGVVHVIDAVMIPPTTVVDVLLKSPIHKTLVAAATAAELVAPLQGKGPFTVFAPTDNAFAALPAGTVEALLGDPKGALANILLYHVLGNRTTYFSDGYFLTTLNGKSVSVRHVNGNLFIDNAKIITKALKADNGIVYVIDAVMIPAKTVVDVLVKSPIHKTLVAAATAAGLVPTLSGNGPFTVFAPTDRAFAALPNGAIQALLGDPEGALKSILTYHVSPGTTPSSALRNGQFIKTVNGQPLFVKINHAGIFINNAKVVVADLKADNGIVHVIDAVMLPSKSVVDIIVNSTELNTLETAVRSAGLLSTLSGAGPFTVFAPTDKAFSAIPASTLQSLLKDPKTLSKILTYHVVAGTAKSGDLSDGQIIKTVNGKDVKVTFKDGNIFINNAKVVVADIIGNNGVVHIIDAVLTPPADPVDVVDIIANSPIHNTLETAVIAAGLVPTLKGAGPFTVFAPTDQAFAALPAGTIQALLNDKKTLTDILTYHVAAGAVKSNTLTNGQIIKTVNGKDIKVTFSNGSIFINNARVTIADVMATNGVVHIINAVLMPPSDVVEIIANSPVHNTLEAAVGAAGLVPTLKGAGPFTVFAPTDNAFAALPAGTVEALLNNIPLLTNILTYHVTGGRVKSTDLANNQVLKMVNGGNANVRIENGKIFINNAQVTVANINASNGVVHVIDAVLLPPPGTANETIAETRSTKTNVANISIYPNPYINELNIDYSNHSKMDANCIIYDQSGRVIYKNTISPSTTVNLEGIQGTLVVKLSNAEFNSTQKVVSINK